MVMASSSDDGDLDVGLDAQRLDQGDARDARQLLRREQLLDRLGVERGTLRQGDLDDGLLADDALDARSLNLSADLLKLLGQLFNVSLQEGVAVGEGERLDMLGSVGLVGCTASLR